MPNAAKPIRLRGGGDKGGDGGGSGLGGDIGQMKQHAWGAALVVVVVSSFIALYATHQHQVTSLEKRVATLERQNADAVLSAARRQEFRGSK